MHVLKSLYPADHVDGPHIAAENDPRWVHGDGIESLIEHPGRMTHASVAGTDLDAWRAAVTPGTRLCFFETVSNPTLEVMDIQGIARIAHDARDGVHDAAMRAHTSSKNASASERV